MEENYLKISLALYIRLEFSQNTTVHPDVNLLLEQELFGPQTMLQTTINLQNMTGYNKLLRDRDYRKYRKINSSYDMLIPFGECRPRHHQTLVCYQTTVK